MRFHNGEITVQERAQARNFGDEFGKGIADFVTPGMKDFLDQRRTIVLGTVGLDGSVWASVYGTIVFVQPSSRPRATAYARRPGCCGSGKIPQRRRILPHPESLA